MTRTTVRPVGHLRRGVAGSAEPARKAIIGTPVSRYLGSGCWATNTGTAMTANIAANPKRSGNGLLRPTERTRANTTPVAKTTAMESATATQLISTNSGIVAKIADAIRA